MDKYIESTENMLSTCKNFESSGTLYENGKIVSMNKSTSENGNDYTEVKINYNNDGVVSGMDIVKTQKIILQLYQIANQKYSTNLHQK